MLRSLGTPAVKKHKTDATHPLPQRAFAYVPTTQLQWAAAQRALTASSLRFALKPETNVKMLLEDLRHHIDDMERATKATKSEAARAAAAARVVEQQQHALLQSQQHRQAPLLHAGGVGAKRRRSSSSGSIVPAVTPSANEAAALWAEDDSGDVVQSARAQRRRRRLSVHDADTLLLQASAAFKRCSDLPSAPNEAAASSAAASGKNSGSSNMMLMTGAATGRRSSSRRVTRSSAPPPTPPVDADAVTAGFTPGESQQPLVHLPGKAAADDLTRSAKQQRVFGDDDNAMAAAAYTPADACTPSLGLFRRSASPFDDVELFAFCQQLRTTGEKHSRRWGGGGSMEDRAESIGCRLGKLPWEDSNDMGSGGGAGGGGGLWADLLASFNKAGDAPAAAGTAGDSGGAGTTGSGGDAVGGNASGVGGNANGAPSPAGPPAGASAGGSGGGGGGRSQQPGGSGGGDPPSAPPPPLDGSAAQASWVVPQAHVALNVGGAVYNTSSEVLTCVPRSFFFDLASMSPHHLATVPRVDGAYFIDRNPQVRPADVPQLTHGGTPRAHTAAVRGAGVALMIAARPH